MGQRGFEPLTSRLSSMRSDLMSYWPTVKDSKLAVKGGDPAAGSPTATLLRLNPSHQIYHIQLPPCG